MYTKIINLLRSFVSQLKNIKKIGFTKSILLNLLGFFLGNIAATSLNLFFGGLGAILVLIGLEFISLLEYHPKTIDNKILKYLSLIKRGFFFGLFTDGFKVGS